MKYFDLIREATAGTKVEAHGREIPLEEAIDETFFLLRALAGYRAKAMLIGNGGSMAACSHMANDLCLARVRAMALDSGPNLSCAGNDFGFEASLQKQVQWFGDPKDVLIALSCSGTSRNVVTAAKNAAALKMLVITFSGDIASAANELRSIGALNFVVPSVHYGIIQLAHEAILHLIIDKIAGIEP